MSRYYYDLHIHSCLSPCGDMESTPASIAGMAKLNGLNMVALTDHNTTLNCPAFFKACEQYDIVPIAGMELTTAEDIHVVCLFPTLEDAMAYNKLVDKKRIKIKNKEKIFGVQSIVDEEDREIGREEDLLVNATQIPIECVQELVRQCNGAAYPAHIDRSSNGAIAMLGDFPHNCGFTAFELQDPENETEYRETYHLENLRLVVSSDAHYLWKIKEKREFFELSDDPAEARNQLIEMLRG